MLIRPGCNLPERLTWLLNNLLPQVHLLTTNLADRRLLCRVRRIFNVPVALEGLAALVCCCLLNCLAGCLAPPQTACHRPLLLCDAACQCKTATCPSAHPGE